MTVRQVLMHTAGLPGLPAGSTPEDLCDTERICAVLTRIDRIVAEMLP